MNDVKSRVSAFLKTKNIEKQNQIASILNISAQAVSGIYNNKSNFTADQLIVLLNMYQDLDARWLLTGQGSMYSGDHNQPTTQEPTLPYNGECMNPACQTQISALKRELELSQKIIRTMEELNQILTSERDELRKKGDPPHLAENKPEGGVGEHYQKTG